LGNLENYIQENYPKPGEIRQQAPSQSRLAVEGSDWLKIGHSFVLVAKGGCLPLSTSMKGRK
jgi:hypothetical protein